MPTFTDGLSRIIDLPTLPQRIISLVPSQTELLYTLGLEDAVVGITKFCVHPAHWQRSKAIVGGTKNINHQRILHLNPDLVIANKEENVQAQVEALYQHVPVWLSDVYNLAGALQMIQTIGELTGTVTKANSLAGNIALKFAALQPLPKPMRVAYLIWRQPYMTIGGDTFIHHLLTLAGFHNVFGDHQRYPVVNHEDLISQNPGVIFLSSEPYPFKQTHAAEMQKILPHTHVLLTDGELLSWYGSRLLYAAPYLQDLQNKVLTTVSQ